MQETRRWDDDEGVSLGMRSKEDAQDYRYFPEPDLLPMEISGEWLVEIRGNLPEPAHMKRERYTRDLGLTGSEASLLTSHKNISAIFEAIAERSGEPTETARLMTGEIMRLVNDTNTLPEDLHIDERKFATLIALVTTEKINRNAYKETIEAVFLHDADPEAYIAEKGLMMVSDDSAITRAVAEVLDANPAAIAEYREGKEKVFGFLMGQVMRKLGGAGNPDIIKKSLKEMLDE